MSTTTLAAVVAAMTSVPQDGRFARGFSACSRGCAWASYAGGPVDVRQPRADVRLAKLPVGRLGRGQLLWWHCLPSTYGGRNCATVFSPSANRFSRHHARNIR